GAVERGPSLSPPRMPALPPSSAPPPASELPPRSSHRPPSPSSISWTTSAPPPRRASSGSIRLPVQGRVKGTAIRTGLLWFTQKYGADVVARVAEAAPAEVASLLRLDDPGFGIVASGWYDGIGGGELLLRLEQAVGIDH